MARLPYPDDGKLDADTKERIGLMGRPLNIFRMLAHSPVMLKGLQDFGSGILTQQALSPALRELAILRVANRSNAHYEWSQHVPIALACKVEQGQIDALEAGRADAACFDEKERAVLAAVDELLVGARLSDGALAALKGFLSEAEIVEFLLAVGFYMLVARFLATTEVELEAGGIPDADQVNPRFAGGKA